MIDTSLERLLATARAPTYSSANWYWVVADDKTQVYSSAAGAYVPLDDATYKAWLAGGRRPSKQATEQELFEYLNKQFGT